jgi:transcriptional regulatory protein LevR
MKGKKSPFEERFELLIQSGQASEASVAAARWVLGVVESSYDISISEELGASLANHVAISIKRLLSHETLIEAPDVLWKELEEYPQEYRLAVFIVGELEKIVQNPMPRDEAGFIAIHLCKIKVEAGLSS